MALMNSQRPSGCTLSTSSARWERIVGRRRSTALELKARETKRRRRVWSGPSLNRIASPTDSYSRPEVMPCISSSQWPNVRSRGSPASSRTVSASRTAKPSGVVASQCPSAWRAAIRSGASCWNVGESVSRLGRLWSVARDIRDLLNDRSFSCYDSDVSRRDQLLQTALALFAEQGVSGTSMRDLAKGAGLSVAAAYHHFESKQALLQALFEEQFDNAQWFDEAQMHAAAAELRESPRVDALASIIEGMLERLDAHADFVRLVHVEVLHGDPDANAVSQKM